MACIFGHKWNGCKCEKCNKTRDEQHDWDLCKGKCKLCGKTCKQQHDWNYCTCTVCGEKRGLSLGGKNCNFLPIVGECKAKCSVCGYTKETHDWNNCVCKKCGIVITHIEDYDHDWKLIEGTCEEKCSVCGGKRIAGIVKNNLRKNLIFLEPAKIEKLIAELRDENQLAEIVIARDFHSEYHENYQYTPEWRILSVIRNNHFLQKIVKEAKYSRFCWKACKMMGGHFYDNEAVNKCKCTVCGFQYHKTINDICERCNGTITVPPFVTGYPHGTITFSNGTKETFLGYDGILSGEDDLI